MHTEPKQYAVIICEQFRRRYSMDFFLVLFRRIADEITVVTSVWEVYSNCLTIS